MKSLALCAVLLAAGLHADVTPAAATAAVTVAPNPVTAPAIQPTPAPTAKPLYVDYTPPDWAKAKEHITFEQAKKWVKDKSVLFCDARAKVEYDQGHIPGAIPLPTGEFDKYYAIHEARIKKARKLVTYCHGIGCRLSEKAANSLVDKGHKNVAVFFGGEPQWREHNMEFQTGDTFAKDADTMAKPTPIPVGGTVPGTPAAAMIVTPAAAAASAASPAVTPAPAAEPKK